jgi:hypothetical protein
MDKRTKMGGEMADGMAFKKMLMKGLRTRSGYEERRAYLGMSGIGNCARKLFMDYVNGRHTDDQGYWYCWTGYLFEAGVLALLGLEKREREITASFDARFRGHTDFYTDDGTVVDVKSTTLEKFIAVKKAGPPFAHVAQMQMYMRHGQYGKAVLIYTVRDIPARAWTEPFWTVDVPPDRALMDRLDFKAKMILEAIDRRIPPACECGYCRS